MRRNTLRIAARVAAVVGTTAMTGTQLLAAPVFGQQVARHIEASKPRQLPVGQTQTLSPEEWKQVEAKRAADAAAQSKIPMVRPLTVKEMAQVKGRGENRNAAFAGTLPWHRSFRDVNLSTGNLFKSFTDIQVAPAKGAGLALQRTYNSNEEREGPFGIGWTHAYDIRIEEEGLSPDTGEEKVGRNDFFGGEHRYTRDADGLYTPPPYLYDEMDSKYGEFLANGPDTTHEGQKVLEDTQRTMDGTVKHFIAGGPDDERVCNYIDDRHGNRTTLTYATLGGKLRLTEVKDPSNRTLTFHWLELASGVWRVVQVDGPLYSVVYTYDGGHQLWKVTLDATNPASGVSAVVGSAPHENRTTTFTYTTVQAGQYGESGLLASIADPLNHTVSYTYSADPTSTLTGTVWVASVTEPAGVDGGGTPRTQAWTIGASLVNNVVETVCSSTSGGVSFTARSDLFLRFLGYAYGSAYSFYTQYDSSNNVTQKETPVTSNSGVSNSIISKRVDRFTYGPHGNVLTHTIDGFSGTETTTYYNASKYFQKASFTDFNGRTSSVDYFEKSDTNAGNRGQVKWVRDPGYSVNTSPSYNKQFTFTYNSVGQKATETNLKDVVTQYTYGDTWGNLTQVIQDYGTGKLNRTTSMVYDVGGRVTQTTDPSGYISNFDFNNLGQPESAAFPATTNTPAETVTYTYGGNGRLATVADNRGTTSLAYETGCDRVSSVTDPVTGALSYTYNRSGERATMSLPGGGTWTYDYSGQLYARDDPNSFGKLLSRITDDQDRIVDYTLDAFGPLKQVKFNQTFSGTTLLTYCQTDYTYDAGSSSANTHGWLKQIQHTWHYKNMGFWTQSPLMQNDYTYDLAGMRQDNAVREAGTLTRTEQYGYDELYRLKTVNYGENSHTQTYAFDAMGNRTQRQDSLNGTENYTYNNANMLLTRGANNYTNDNNGNTLTGGGRTNTWDSQNRLAQCVYNGNTSVFTYSADGLRRRSVVNGTTTDYVLDNSMFLREIRNGSNVATYLMGARGPEYRRDDAASTIQWYLYDGLGSVTGEVAPNGTVTSARKFDVYGVVRGGTNPGGTSRHKFVGQLGHPSEDEIGLIYMRARYMDPVTGRFASEDPALHGTNWFVYCRNNPVNRVDSTGKSDELIDQLVKEAIADLLEDTADYWMRYEKVNRRESFWAFQNAGKYESLAFAAEAEQKLREANEFKAKSAAELERAGYHAAEAALASFYSTLLRTAAEILRNGDDIDFSSLRIQ